MVKQLLFLFPRVGGGLGQYSATQLWTPACAGEQLCDRVGVGVPQQQNSPVLAPIQEILSFARAGLRYFEGHSFFIFMSCFLPMTPNFFLIPSRPRTGEAAL